MAKTHSFNNVEEIILYLLDGIVFPFFFVFAHTAIIPTVKYIFDMEWLILKFIQINSLLFEECKKWESNACS